MSAASSCGSNSKFHYSEQRHAEELARLVCAENLSFDFGEKLTFVNVCQRALNPAAQPIPNKTIKQIVYKLYKQGKKDLQILFRNFTGRVAICTDIWSDCWNVNSFMRITCHWIDKDWNMKKRVLAFYILEEMPTAYNICRSMKPTLKEYNLI